MVLATRVDGFFLTIRSQSGFTTYKAKSVKEINYLLKPVKSAPASKTV